MVVLLKSVGHFSSTVLTLTYKTDLSKNFLVTIRSLEMENRILAAFTITNLQ